MNAQQSAGIGHGHDEQGGATFESNNAAVEACRSILIKDQGITQTTLELETSKSSEASDLREQTALAKGIRFTFPSSSRQASDSLDFDMRSPPSIFHQSLTTDTLDVSQAVTPSLAHPPLGQQHQTRKHIFSPSRCLPPKRKRHSQPIKGASALLKLPLELRLMIYHKVLCFRHRLRKSKPYLFRPRNPSRDRDNLALIRVCRQIHSETVAILYEVNVFSLTADMVSCCGHNNFHLLQHVDFTFHEDGDFLYRIYVSGGADKWAATNITSLARQCPALKTFSLRITPDAMEREALGVYVKRGSQLQLAMSSLEACRADEGICIVLEAKPFLNWTQYESFFDAIAPATQWSYTIQWNEHERLGSMVGQARVLKFRRKFPKIENTTGRCHTLIAEGNLAT